MSVKRELLQALQELHTMVPYLKERRMCPCAWWCSPRRGICGNVYGYMQFHGAVSTLEYMRLLEDTAASWPEAHHGARAYPVGGVKEYQAGENAHMLWLNPKRVELLEWLIATLTEELSAEPVQQWSPTP